MPSPQLHDHPHLPPQDCEPPLKAGYHRLGRSGKLSLWFGIAQTVMIFAVMLLALWQPVPLPVLAQNLAAGVVFAVVLWHCAHARSKAFLLLALLYLLFAFGFSVTTNDGWGLNFDLNLPLRLPVAFGGQFDGFTLHLAFDLLALLACGLSVNVWRRLRRLPPLPKQPCPEERGYDGEFDEEL